MVQQEYILYTIIIFIALGLLISFLPTKKKDDKGE